METLVELKKEGNIKHIGFSECSSDTLRRGYAVHPISAVQIEYNPWMLDIESETGRGFLTGRYKSLDDFEEKDTRRQLPRFSPENFSKNLDLVNIFENLAARKGCTPAQIVLAWIMAQGPGLFPIPGTKTIQYLEQNLGAVDMKISPEENKHVRDTLISMGGC